MSAGSDSRPVQRPDTRREQRGGGAGQPTSESSGADHASASSREYSAAGSRARDRRREGVGDGLVGHVAVVLDQPAGPVEIVDDVGLVVVGGPRRVERPVVTSSSCSGPFRPMPPYSSEASPISLVLSPASRDMIAYGPADHRVLRRERRQERTLDHLPSITTPEEPGLPRPLSALKPKCENAASLTWTSCLRSRSCTARCSPR